jgi:hypothetical protein
MALPLGLENKRQVYLAAALFSVVALIGGWELYTSFAGPSTPRPVPQVATPVKATAAAPATLAATQATAPSAQKLDNIGIDPSLHMDKLAQSENIEYEGTGRNIFSAESAPVKIPVPAASARPTVPVATGPPPPPPVPKPPAIDLKYFGYSQKSDKSFVAYFTHGEDVFVAKSGEIVDRRYKVGTIKANSVEVTDLSYNNTQTLSLAAF